MTFTLTPAAFNSLVEGASSSVSDVDHGPLRQPDKPPFRSLIEAALKFDKDNQPMGHIDISKAIDELQLLRSELKELANFSNEQVWVKRDIPLGELVRSLQKDRGLPLECTTWGGRSLKDLRDKVVECRTAMAARTEIDVLTGTLAEQSGRISRAKAEVRETAENLHRHAESGLKDLAALLQVFPTKFSPNDLANLAVKVQDIESVLSRKRPAGPAMAHADLSTVRSTLRMPFQVGPAGVKDAPHTVPLPGSALANYLASRRGAPPRNEASLQSAELGYSLTTALIAPNVVAPKWPSESENRSQPAESRSRGHSPRTDRR